MLFQYLIRLQKTTKEKKAPEHNSNAAVWKPTLRNLEMGVFFSAFVIELPTRIRHANH